LEIFSSLSQFLISGSLKIPNLQFAANVWAEYFTLFELTEIMRQKDDKEFVQLLNRLREGKHSEDDITILKQRLVNVRPGQDNHPMNMAHLLYYKCIRRCLNTALYNLSKADKAQIKLLTL